MNIILVLIDSLNRDALEAYGAKRVKTPNLSRFAERAWRMNSHFVGSLPCMPARREIFAGRKEMTWRPWGPLEPYDARLPKLLEAHGHSTAIVTDHYHYWEEEANGYLQSFQSTSLIRGHENDNWQPPVPNSDSVPAWVEHIETWRPGKGRGYYANVKDFQREEDYFPAKVMSTAANWLSRHARQAPFCLQVESFDVHEPFDVPEPYASMYTDEADKSRFNIWPPYQDAEQLAAFMASTSEEELEFIRSQYYAKVTMVDRWFGTLLDTLDTLSLWDDTAVIVTTDHGHDLGQRKAFGKQYPHFDSHANIPMFIWHPTFPGHGKVHQALTTTVDLHATILDIAGAEHANAPHSQSFLPALQGNANQHRDALLYGTFGEGVCCTDGTWTLFKSPERSTPLYSYSPQLFKSLTVDSVHPPNGHDFFIPGVDFPQWKVPIQVPFHDHQNYLFNRADDPKQEHNLWHQDIQQRERMLDLMRRLLQEEGTPPELFERLGLKSG